MKPTSAPSTEAVNPRGEDLDLATAREVIFRLHEEDKAAVEAVGRVLPSVTEAAQAAANALRAGGRLIYVGAGTSGRLGALDAAECPPTFGTHPEQVIALLAGGPGALLRAIEDAEDDAPAGAREIRAIGVGPKDLVCGVSASGTTPFVQGALKAAHAAGAKTVLVCCSRGKELPRLADILVLPQTGPELVAGSTRLKAGTATKLVLNAISTTAMIALGKVYRGRMVELAAGNRKLAARAQQIVIELAGVSPKEAARLLAKAKGRPSVALAMRWTGLSAAGAERALLGSSLRELERRAATRKVRPTPR